MKKIVVAGCGHGGLQAARVLSEKGFEVEVFEAKERKDLGFDWHDCVYMPELEKLGINIPPCDALIPYPDCSYTSPSKNVKLTVKREPGSKLFSIDRKYLIEYLVDAAEKAGAFIHFGTPVMGALVKHNEVKGIITRDGEVYSDLVIDAAGINSPVRSSLPASFGILNNIPEKGTFYTYRVYYENTTGETNEPEFEIYFYHCGKRGMDWVITDRNFIDILVGRFDPFTEDDMIEAVQDFKAEYPYMGDKIIRGGSYETIPLRLPLPLFVWNGYAAVGDSAAMTEPMSGSGINNSIRAGSILAETVIGARAGRMTLEVLWKYQYRYFKEKGESCFGAENTRNMLTSLDAKDIDYFFDKKILTEKELGAGGSVPTNAAETFSRILAFMMKLNLLPALSGVPLKNSIGERVKKLMPEKYSHGAYLRWRAEYEKICGSGS